MANRRGKIDIALEKLVSRKLFVLVLSISLLFFGKLDGTQFVDVAKIYIGTQAVVDAVQMLKKKHEEEEEDNGEGS